MTRGNSLPSAATLADDVQRPPASKEARSKGSGKGSKVSREAQSLLRTNIIIEQRQPQGTHEGLKVQSAGPSSADGKPQKKKRASSSPAADDPPDEPHDEQENRRPKKAKNAEYQRQAPRSGSGGEAGGSGGVGRPSHAADPGIFAAVPKTSLGIEMGAQPKGESKRNSKAQQWASADQRAVDGSTAAGSMHAADPAGADQPAANNGPSKKSRGGEGKAAAPAPNDVGPSSAAALMGQDAGQPRATSQSAEEAPARQAAPNPVANAALAVAATANPPVDAARPPVAVAAALAPVPLRGRQETVVAVRRQPVPSSSAEGATGSGPSGCTQEPNRGPALKAPPQAAAEAGNAAGSQQFPPTGTTPVKPFVLPPLPRLDKIGQQERRAFVDLQRQLAEMHALYDDLKATKIQDLDKVLAEQEEFAAEQVRQAEHRAQLWQAAAERAEQNAKAAGSQEMQDHLRMLQIQTEQLLEQNSSLLEQVTQLQRELAQAQMAYHDVRAKLAANEAAQDVAAQDEDADGFQGEAEELEQRSQEAACAEDPESGDGVQGQYADETQHAADIAAHTEPLPDVTFGGGVSPGVNAVAAADAAAGGGDGGSTASVHHGLKRAVGLQFPSPSPGVGVQFPSPSVNLLRQGMLGTLPGSSHRTGQRGVGTECQLVVNMLPHLRTPSPSSQSHGPAGVPPMSTADATLSGGRGISTECQRVVQMLPGLRMPSPSVQSRHLPSTAGGDGDGVTPVAANGAEGPRDARPGTGKRRSTGSPIDGVCQAGGGNMDSDLSHAHGLGAPEAFQLAAQKGEYSFVDLNPASARKNARAGAGPAATTAGAGTAAPAVALGKPGVSAKKDRLQRAGHASGTAALVAAAAATALPLSPAVHASPKPGHLHDTRPDAAAMAAAVAIHSSSARGSCNLPGLVARATAQGQDVPRRFDTLAVAAQSPQAGVAQQSPVPSGRPPAVSPGRAVARPPGSSPVCAAAAPHDGMRQGAGILSCPSPRAAKIKFLEEKLGWKAEPVDKSPGNMRMTHAATGLIFTLRETAEPGDEEIDETNSDQPQIAMGRPATKWLEYEPVNMGTAGERLNMYYKETLLFLEEDVPTFLSNIAKAVEDAMAKEG